MTDSIYVELLKGCNQSNLTGLESQQFSDTMGSEWRVTAYSDNYGQWRVVLKDRIGGANVAAILYDQSNVVRFRFVMASYRGQNLSKQLHAFTQAFINRKVRHSSNLTDSGAASL